MGVLSISTKNETVTWKGKRLPCGRHFFVLYCFLAARRLLDRTGAGAAEAVEILKLPDWHQNDVLSVGKQIQNERKRLAKEGLECPIEGRQKIKGPFWLAVSPEQIKLDGEPERILAELMARTAADLVSENEAEELYRFVGRFWRANSAFEEGSLTVAIQEFRSVIRTTLPPIFSLAAQYHLATALERRGKYDMALREVRMALARVRRVYAYRSWIESRLLTLRGWLLYRMRRLPEAGRTYDRALALVLANEDFLTIGHVWNGFGEIAKERHEYAEALADYRRALACWALAEFTYGIQAVYFNIGRLHARWADQLSAGGFDDEAKARYRVALSWVEECMAVCQKLGIGYDVTDDEIMRASLYRKLGELPSSIRSAEVAIRNAEFSGNMRNLAQAYRQKAKTLLAQGKRKDALETFSDFERVVDSQFRAIFEKSLRDAIDGHA